jgi:hypothetical protein
MVEASLLRDPSALPCYQFDSNRAKITTCCGHRVVLPRRSTGLYLVTCGERLAQRPRAWPFAGLELVQFAARICTYITYNL